MEKQYKYDNQGNKIEEYYNDENGDYHSDGDIPSRILFYKDGKIEREIYYKHGFKHRGNDKPCDIEYYESGNISHEHFYIKGMMDRITDFPSLIEYNDTPHKDIFYCVYFKNGKIHNELGAAFSQYSPDGKKTKEDFYLNGKKLEGKELKLFKRTIILKQIKQ